MRPDPYFHVAGSMDFEGYTDFEIYMAIKAMKEAERMEQKELLEFLEKEGYENVRVLEDGTIVGTSELIFTTAVYVGLNQWGWEKRFCFEDQDLALTEVSKLKSGDDEPTGYIARRNG